MDGVDQDLLSAETEEAWKKEVHVGGEVHGTILSVYTRQIISTLDPISDHLQCSQLTLSLQQDAFMYVIRLYLSYLGVEFKYAQSIQDHSNRFLARMSPINVPIIESIRIEVANMQANASTLLSFFKSSSSPVVVDWVLHRGSLLAASLQEAFCRLLQRIQIWWKAFKERVASERWAFFVINFHLESEGKNFTGATLLADLKVNNSVSCFY